MEVDPCVMDVLVTNPAMEISGVAAIFSENVAVKVTTPEVMMLSESFDESVSVAFEVGGGQVPQTGIKLLSDLKYPNQVYA